MVGSVLTFFVLTLVVRDSQHASADDINMVGLEDLKAGQHASKYLADKPWNRAAWKYLETKPRRKRAAILKGFSTFHLPIRLDALIETKPCDHHILEIF